MPSKDPAIQKDREPVQTNQHQAAELLTAELQCCGVEEVTTAMVLDSLAVAGLRLEVGPGASEAYMEAIKQ